MQVMDAIFKDLQKTIRNIVIKYENQAKAAETVESRRASDYYMSSIQGIDTFNTYQSFDARAYVNAGIIDQQLIDRYNGDKYLIPREIRDRLVSEQRKLIIQEYVEQNNYYRMLSGLPDFNDMTVVFVDPAICAKLGLDPNTPIHEYTDDQIISLSAKGYMDEIIKANPTKGYLKYLGDNRINLVRARRAKNFAILRMTKDVSDTFNEEFNTIYDQSREYFMSVIYNKNYGSQYEMYDNFMSMMVMIMTIQRLISNVFKYGIEYDFYDLGSIKMVFDAYSVPFISNIPIDYQRMLIRNLNNLLRYKATDKVLYDICSLLGLDGVKLFKYFLFKEHRFSNDGTPIFKYKEVDDGFGNVTIEEDVEDMYRIFFQSVELKDRNTASALTENANILDYNQTVVDDPYWWADDQELTDTIYKSEYNYVESKYLSMNMMYKLSKMLFEVSYVFNMLIDKKDEIENKVTIQLPRMFEDRDIDLFDFTCLLCALISKKNNMAGNIMHTPSKILTVMGFNFAADFASIRQELMNDPEVDPKVLGYIQNLTINSVADVNRLYGNIRDLNDFLIDRMSRTQSLNEYRTYRKLYDTIYVTQHMNSLFEKSDGSVAETFFEYLENQNSMLHRFVQDVSIDDIGEYINHMLVRLNNLAKDLKYLNIVTDANTVLLEAAITLIRFFKSYSTDLTSFNVLYLLDSRYFNMVRMIGVVRSLNKNLEYIDIGMLRNYKTSLSYTAGLSVDQALNVIDDPWFYINMTEKDLIDMVSNINSFKVQDKVNTLIYLKENFASFVNIVFREKLTITDWKFVSSTFYRTDRTLFTDMILDMASVIDHRDTELVKLIDQLYDITKESVISSGLEFTDTRSMVKSMGTDGSVISMSDRARASNSRVVSSNLDKLHDVIENAYKLLGYKNKTLRLKDKIDSYYQYDIKDKSLSFDEDLIWGESNMDIDMDMDLSERIFDMLSVFMRRYYISLRDQEKHIDKVDEIKVTTELDDAAVFNLTDQHVDSLSLRYMSYLSLLGKQISNREGFPLQDRLVIEWER